MNETKLTTSIAILGAISVIGIILYKTKGNLSPELIFRIISSIIMLSVLIYVSFFYTKNK